MVLVAVIPTAPVRALVEGTRHSPGSNAAGNASVVLYARPRRSRNHIMTAGEVCRGVRCRIVGPYRAPHALTASVSRTRASTLPDRWGDAQGGTGLCWLICSWVHMPNYPVARIVCS